MRLSLRYWRHWHAAAAQSLRLGPRPAGGPDGAGPSLRVIQVASEPQAQVVTERPDSDDTGPRRAGARAGLRPKLRRAATVKAGAGADS